MAKLRVLNELSNREVEITVKSGTTIEGKLIDVAERIADCHDGARYYLRHEDGRVAVDVVGIDELYIASFSVRLPG